MNKEDTNKKHKTQEEIFEEIKRLAAKADESSNQQMDLFEGQKLGDEDIDFSFNSSIINDTADPDRSYKLYYGIRRLLIDYLPKGQEYKELRKQIYDQKNLYLNRGIDINNEGIRGSDGRMSYISGFLETVFDIVAQWITTGANSYDIFITLYDLNQKMGYHKSK
jgi:hypothetical protein